MKSKLLLYLNVVLFCSQFVHSQIWEVVGNAQYTNESSYISTTVDSNSGFIYTAYVDQSDNNHLKVKYFDGSNWLDLGGNVTTNGNASYPDIKINPFNNQVWVAYRQDPASGTGQLMVKSFDGTNWVSEGSDIGYGNEIPTEKIILQFRFNNGNAYIASIYEAAGVNRIAAVVSNRTGTWADEVFLTNDLIPYGLAYNQYDRVIYGRVPNGSGVQTTTIEMKAYNFNNDTWNIPNSFNAGNTTCIGLGATNSGSTINSATFEDSSNLLKIGMIDTPLNNGNQLDGNSIQFVENFANNKSYLLYTEANGSIFVHEYDPTQVDIFDPLAVWTTIFNGIFNIGAETTQVSLSVDQLTGQVYLTHKDGNSITTREFLPNAQLDRVYVDPSATGFNNGSSWENAFTDLQTGINAASNTVEKSVWIAEGIYKPGTQRTDSFLVDDNGINIIGGFNGTETAIDQRDIKSNPTILSGDLNGDDDPNDLSYTSSTRIENSFSVVNINANDIEIDGVTITAGQANNTNNNNQNRGSAIFKDPNAANLSIKNSIITKNVSNVSGSLYLRSTQDSNITIESCEFSSNLSRYGSGFDASVNISGPTMTILVNNSIFHNNISRNIPAGLGLSGSSFSILLNNGGAANVTITNNTFTNNIDSTTDSGIDIGTIALRRFNLNDVLNVQMHNNIFWNNYTDNSSTVVANQNIGLINGSNAISTLNFTHNNSNQTNLNTKVATLTENNNFDTDPLFVDEANFDFSLQASSSLIDSGDNNQIPNGITTDIIGNSRIINSTVDLGAYEYVSLANNDFDTNEFSISVYPNPTRDIINVEAQNAQIDQIDIFDINGKKVKTSRVGKINVSDLSNGVYLMKINSDKTNAVKIMRFIKQ